MYSIIGGETVPLHELSRAEYFNYYDYALSELNRQFTTSHQSVPDYSYCTVSQTPYPDFCSSPNENSQSYSSKEDKQPKRVHKPKTEILKRKPKKFWTTEQKAFAIEKSKTLGLSKTTKFLKQNYPIIYGDLSSSTLQYWMYKDKLDQHEKKKEE